MEASGEGAFALKVAGGHLWCLIKLQALVKVFLKQGPFTTSKWA